MTLILKKYSKFNGDMLYNRRMELGLTLLEISKKTKVTMNAVHQWEAEICKPGPKSMPLLAKALKVEQTYFFKKNGR